MKDSIDDVVVVVEPDEGDTIQIVQNVQKDGEKNNSSHFPDTVYEKLPLILQDACSKFKNRRERDIFLVGALVTLSGCFNNVSGTYDKHRLYPNLFGFVIAPPASGKGVLPFAKSMVSAIHSKAKDQKKDEQANHQAEVKKMINDEVVQNDPDMKNDCKSLFLPADISSAALYKHLEETGGTGIIFETEADTLAKALKQGYGDYSAILRSAYHHEPISYRRKTNNELIEINNLRIAVLLSGTPSQVASLIKSSENGLFSRFAFYNFKSAPVWRDVSPKEGPNLEDYFTKLSERILGMYEFMQEKPTDFSLSEKQWEIFNNHFEKHLIKVSNLVSEDANNIVIRLGSITFRICMILTAIQKAEDRNAAPGGMCFKSFFEAALEMSDIFLEHALAVFNMLPTKNARMSVDQLKFYNTLPKGLPFTRVQAIKMCEYLSVSAKDKFLRKMIEAGLISKGKHGWYLKE